MNIPDDFKPRLTISPWTCPHYKSIHHKDAERCNDPARLWEFHMPDGRVKCCGVAADKRGEYSTIKTPFSLALARYLKVLEAYKRSKPRKHRLVKVMP